MSFCLNNENQICKRKCILIDFDREEIATYEEVAKLYPRPGLYRPIILIGNLCLNFKKYILLCIVTLFYFVNVMFLS